MITALNIVESRIAHEDNARSGIIAHADLREIQAVRVGGHIFKRLHKSSPKSRRGLSSTETAHYVKVLPNGVKKRTK